MINTEHRAPANIEHRTNRLDIGGLVIFAGGGPLLFEHLLIENKQNTFLMSERDISKEHKKDKEAEYLHAFGHLLAFENPSQLLLVRIQWLCTVRIIN